MKGTNIMYKKDFLEETRKFLNNEKSIFNNTNEIFLELNAIVLGTMAAELTDNILERYNHPEYHDEDLKQVLKEEGAF